MVTVTFHYLLIKSLFSSISLEFWNYSITIHGLGTIRLGLLMASTHSVSIDAASAKIAGVKSNFPGYQLTFTEKVGNINFVPFVDYSIALRMLSLEKFKIFSRGLF